MSSTVLSKLNSAIKDHGIEYNIKLRTLMKYVQNKTEDLNTFISECFKDIKAFTNESLKKLNGVQENEIWGLIGEMPTAKELLSTIFKQCNTHKSVIAPESSRQDIINGRPSIQSMLFTGKNRAYVTATGFTNPYGGYEFIFQIHVNEELLLKAMVAKIVEIIQQYRNLFISQSNQNYSKGGPVLLELAVVTSAVFEEAMKLALTGSIVLTYTLVFPSDCRMFISLPIYLDSYIHRKDILTAPNF